jgi:hypothetical protein
MPLPRFYPDVSVEDDLTRDDVGFDYDSLEAAEFEATRAVSEISHDGLPKRRISDVCVKVGNQDGCLLLTVDVPWRFAEPFVHSPETICELRVSPWMEQRTNSLPAGL